MLIGTLTFILKSLFFKQHIIIQRHRLIFKKSQMTAANQTVIVLRSLSREFPLDGLEFSCGYENASQ